VQFAAEAELNSDIDADVAAAAKENKFFGGRNIKYCLLHIFSTW